MSYRVLVRLLRLARREADGQIDVFVWLRLKHIRVVLAVEFFELLDLGVLTPRRYVERVLFI